MDDYDVEKLIDLVKENSAIYDRNSVRYKNSAYKATVWQNIAATLGQTEEEIISRWRNLRDRFCREHRKMTDPHVITPRFEWAYYQDLLFLKDHTIHRKFVNSNSFHIKTIEKYDKPKSPLRMLHVDVVPIKNQKYELEEEPEEYCLNEFNIPDKSYDSSRESSPTPPVTSSKKRKIKMEEHNYNHSARNIMDNEIEAESSQSVSRKTAKFTEISSAKEQFLDEVKVFINGFSETEQNTVQNRIIKYLCKCKLEILNDGNIDNIEI